MSTILKIPGRSRRGSWQRRDAAWGWIFIAPQLIGLVAFVLGPLIFAVILSFMNWDGFGKFEFAGLKNYADQFASADFRASLKNTAFFTILAVPGDLICALVVALGVSNIRGKTIYRLLYFMPVVTSSVAVSVVWLWILNGDYGPLNNYLRDWFHLSPPNWLTDTRFVIPAIALVTIWRSLGFTMVVFLAGLGGIPKSYLEAARVDGATGLQTLVRIKLPLLSPTILFLSITSIIGSFQVFDLAYVMTRGGPGNASRTLVYHIYDLAFVQFTFGEGAAAAVILFLLLLALTAVQLFAQRRWVHYES